MRVRWALEEAGRSYDVRLLSFDAMKHPDHLAIQPFGQIPSYEEDDLVLFESGAIVLHIAETSTVLLPSDRTGRARAIAWMFAALNTVEPSVFERSLLMILERDEPWYKTRLSAVEAVIRARLDSLSMRLGQNTWLEEDFSAGDLLMASVLLRLRGANLLEAYPNLVRYMSRAEARPAYQRAFAAQRAAFNASLNSE